MALSLQLPILAEKVLTYAYDPNLVSYEPRTDLIAVVNDQNEVEIYRLGGQHVLTHKRKARSDTITCIQWIYDGYQVAIGTAGGDVEMVDSQSGASAVLGLDREVSIDHPKAHGDNNARVSFIGWCANTTSADHSSVNKHIPPKDHNGTDQTVQDWFEDVGVTEQPFQNVIDRDPILSPRNLPQQLAMLNIDNILPRISAFSSTSKPAAYDTLSSQAAVDLLFKTRSSSRSPNGIEFTFIGYANGTIKALAGTAFNKDFKNPNRDSTGSYCIIHCAHPLSSYHAVLRGTPATIPAGEDHAGARNDAEQQTPSMSNLGVDVFKVPFADFGGLHGHNIITRATQLMSFNVYLMRALGCIVNEWKTHSTLPKRFMESINETLAEKGQGSLEQNLYHLAMTSDCPPTITEWLRDELAERGHKRWDHATTSLYHSLSHILRANILPALEHYAITASALRGLASFYEGRKTFDVAQEVFTHILDAVACLQLIVHEALQIAGQEERQFRAFSKWLRHQIDLAAAEPGSIGAQEMAEREAVNMDFSRILSYIEGPLVQSRLESMVPAYEKEERVQETMNVLATSSQADVADAIKTARSSKDGTNEKLNLLGWLNQVLMRSQAALTKVADWQRSTWSEPIHVPVEDNRMSSVMDLEMTCKDKDRTNVTIVLVSVEDRGKFVLHNVCIGPASGNGSKTTQHRTQQSVRFPDGANVIHAKILDDKAIVVLVKLDGSHRLLRLDYSIAQPHFTDEDEDLSYTDSIERLTTHVFPKAEGFVPLRFLVNNIPGKRNVCVLSKDCRQWKILDLEQPGYGSDAMSNEEDMGGESGERDVDADSMVVD